MPAPGPSPPLRPGGAGLDSRQTRKERLGRRGVPPPLPQSGAGRRGLPLPPLPRRRPLGSGARRPCPSRALSSLPRPAALSSCRKFQKLSIIPAQRAVRAAKAPRRRATCRPAARPALGPHPVQPGRVATSGRAGAKPAALPAPRARRNAWQPRPGAILSGRGAARPRCFRLFPGPRPASPGPRLPAEWGRGGGSRGGEREEPSRSGSGSARGLEAPGSGPDLRSRPGLTGGVINSAPGSGSGSRAPATCTPLLPRAQAARRSLRSGGLRPNWIAPP